MMKDFSSAVKTVIFPLLAGWLVGLIIQGDTGLYGVLILPPFALPASLFFPVWSVLYLMMGIALFLFRKTAADLALRSEGQLLFFVQLFLNLLWPIVFFRFRLFFSAFLVLVILFVFILLTVAQFYRANRISGILLLPYLLYTLYAGYLNFAIYLLNL